MTNVTIGLSPEIGALIQRFIMAGLSVKALTILAIAAITFGFLDLLLARNLERIQESVTKMTGVCKISVVLLLATLIPIASGAIQIWTDRFRIEYLFAIGIGLFLGIILSVVLRRKLPEEHPDKNSSGLMIITALVIFMDYLTENLAIWGQKIIIWTVNVSLRTLRSPFIIHYAVFSVILNLVISMGLTALIGSSQVAGEANMVGSIIGGIAHALIRRGKIQQLRKTLMEDKS